jgi:uncharacterized membrane protein
MVIMNLPKSTIIIWAISLLAFAVGIYFYPQMPAQIASHWNARGEVDGYMGKFWGIFLAPFIMLGMALLFILLPRIDPLRENYQRFRSYYDGFFILLAVFFLIIQLQVILWSKGIQISPNVVFPIAVGLLFFYIGIFCEHAKMNWFIGIRTPWTLSNEKVWEKTHRLGGKLFKLAGGVAIIGVFFGKLAFAFVMVPVLMVAIYTVVYSYFAYQKEIKGATT